MVAKLSSNKFPAEKIVEFSTKGLTPAPPIVETIYFCMILVQKHLPDGFSGDLHLTMIDAEKK